MKKTWFTSLTICSWYTKLLSTLPSQQNTLFCLLGLLKPDTYSQSSGEWCVWKEGGGGGGIKTKQGDVRSRTGTIQKVAPQKISK